MSDRAAAPPPAGWLRAIGYATTEPEVEEALRAILEEAVPAAGAAAGAVLEREGFRCRASWGMEPAELLPMLCEGSALRGALSRQEEWIDRVLPLPLPPGDAPEGPPRELLLAPLRVRELASGALALRYPAGRAPDEVERAAALAFAGLMGLVLENHRLYEEARRAVQLRDHFLAALNHELRTPASSLALGAEMLRAGLYGELPPRLDGALREVEENVREMMEVLRRVLDLGRLESQPAPERTDLIQPRELVAELLRRVEPAARRKQLSLALYVPRSLPPLQTDTPSVSRILLHLLSNAVKYTASGGIEVRLERSSRMTGSARQEPVLIVRVRDTGTGIPPEQIERVFEPFAQVEEGARTDSRSRGLGLGLPLARQLARSLGGDVRVESTPGRGTEASLILPYRQPGRSG